MVSNHKQVPERLIQKSIGPSIGHFTTKTLINKQNLKDFERLANNNVNIMQIFIDLDVNQGDIKNNIKQFKTFIKKHNFELIVHSSYKHNLSKDWDNNSWWVKNTIKEIQFASLIGAKGVVLHMGKKMDLLIEQAINNMYTALLHIHMATKKYSDVKIILETSAGQGTELCSDIINFGKFYDKLKSIKELKNRFGICIDTCHIFVAGYDIKTISGFTKFISKFDKIIGIDNISLLHLNDSFNDINSKIDRHQTLGDGYIGIKSLTYITTFFKKLNIPIIIETNATDWLDEINKLKLN